MLSLSISVSLLNCHRWLVLPNMLLISQCQGQVWFLRYVSIYEYSHTGLRKATHWGSMLCGHCLYILLPLSLNLYFFFFLNLYFLSDIHRQWRMFQGLGASTQSSSHLLVTSPSTWIDCLPCLSLLGELALTILSLSAPVPPRNLCFLLILVVWEGYGSGLQYPWRWPSHSA